jgi:hypothetical protein
MQRLRSWAAALPRRRQGGSAGSAATPATSEDREGSRPQDVTVSAIAPLALTRPSGW